MNMKLRIENVGNIQLAPDYWDCECEENYIHKKRESTCPLCKTMSDDQPDSRVDEMKRLLKAGSFSIV